MLVYIFISEFLFLSFWGQLLLYLSYLWLFFLADIDIFPEFFMFFPFRHFLNLLLRQLNPSSQHDFSSFLILFPDFTFMKQVKLNLKTHNYNDKGCFRVSFFDLKTSELAFSISRWNSPGKSSIFLKNLVRFSELWMFPFLHLLE